MNVIKLDIQHFTLDREKLNIEYETKFQDQYSKNTVNGLFNALDRNLSTKGYF
jgi:hypothetical protein